MGAHIRYADLGPFPFYCGFTTNPMRYVREMTRLGIPDPPPFVSPGTDATAHLLTSALLAATTIVCLNRTRMLKPHPAQLAAMLAHEAVHVKQNLMDAIGERAPSIEFEAYIVQGATQFFINEYMAGR